MLQCGKECELNFVMICIEVMEVRVRHGKFRNTGFEVGYDLRDLVLTPDQIRLRLFENGISNYNLVGVRLG